MKLSEKIYTRRKQLGLSQEALAEKLGVSRQAVSKWETGEAEPEIGKLKLLAQAFDVTADWLLSEEEPQPEPEPQAESQPEYRIPKRQPDHFDRTVGLVGKMARRWGWLAGVYVALSGGGLLLFGLIASSMGNSFDRTVESFTGGLGLVGGFGPGTYMEIEGQMYPMTASNPVSVLGSVVTFAGVCVIIAGIALAIYLKNKGEE